MVTDVEVVVNDELFIMAEANYYGDWESWNDTPFYMFRKGEWEGDGEWLGTINLRKEGEFEGQHWMGIVQWEEGKEVSIYEKGLIINALENHLASQGFCWVLVGL